MLLDPPRLLSTTNLGYPLFVEMREHHMLSSSTTRWTLIVGHILLLSSSGCGKTPLLSENRKNFPPWEKLPEGNGIHYVDKLTRDPGIDPLYLAKLTYHDEAALQKIIDTFGLVPHNGTDEPSTFTTTLNPPPTWFPLQTVTDRYVFPPGQHEYVANLWVDKESKTAIIERTWW
jgi:hypothetical protein